MFIPICLWHGEVALSIIDIVHPFLLVPLPTTFIRYLLLEMMSTVLTAVMFIAAGMMDTVFVYQMVLNNLKFVGFLG